jgi:hypothetical protein
MLIHFLCFACNISDIKTLSHLRTCLNGEALAFTVSRSGNISTKVVSLLFAPPAFCTAFWKGQKTHCTPKLYSAIDSQVSQVHCMIWPMLLPPEIVKQVVINHCLSSFPSMPQKWYNHAKFGNVFFLWFWKWKNSAMLPFSLISDNTAKSLYLLLQFYMPLWLDILSFPKMSLLIRGLTKNLEIN